MLTATKRRTVAVRIGGVGEDVLLEAASNMRTEDAVESLRALRMSPEETIRWCIGRSEWSAGVWINEDLVGVCGLARSTLLSPKGYPWAFSTNKAGAHPRRFALVSKSIFDGMYSSCPGGMEVMIDADYSTAVRWARWLGFTLTGPEAYGPDAMPFMRATIGDHDA